ncbi:MAG: sulfite exporter TauE/SafE family protein [Myxococcales bacterium]|nr:sulfite exporter TauE/SafE family protein [Myxococcales bacterium]
MSPFSRLLVPAPPLLLAAALGMTALAALVQGTIGFGFAIVSVPVLSLVDKRLAPVPQLLVVVPLTFAMFFRERGAADLRGLGWVLVGRFPGAALGVLALKMANALTLDLLVAASVLVAVVAIATGREVPRGPLSYVVAGLTSGAFAVISSIGGPPLALLYRGAAAGELRATLAAIFSVGVLITIGSRLIAGAISARDLALAIWMAPALAVGMWLSRSLIKRLGDGKAFRVAVLVVAGLAGVGLVVRALLRA